jgi:polyhydroxyalkanoate synthesis regulator phasin
LNLPSFIFIHRFFASHLDSRPSTSADSSPTSIMPTDAAAQSPAPSEAKLNSVANSTAPAAGTSTELLDFPHYRELLKSLRNNTKRKNATAKVDAIIAENPGKSLDELVAEGKINADQKAQALKKPAIQAAIAQTEEQLAHYNELAAIYEQRLASQKAELEEAHKQEVESLQEKAAAAAAAEVPESPKEDIDQKLLSLSKFLSAVANLRHTGDGTSPKSRAFEGVLFQVYGGSLDAVASMKKLIDGVDEKISSVEGETLDITYSKVKQLSEQGTPAEEPASEATPAADPTTANAAYTELDDPAYVTAAHDAAAPAVEAENIPPPPQTLVPDAANAVAEAAWEPHADPLASSTNTEGYVEIPRDPAETDTGLQATIGNISADVVTDASAEPVKAGGDDFKQVVHHQRQGSFRGRGPRRGRGDGQRGGGRGRGDGRGRGRGRGGFRGRGGPNGAPAVTPVSQ